MAEEGPACMVPEVGPLPGTEAERSSRQAIAHSCLGGHDIGRQARATAVREVSEGTGVAAWGCLGRPGMAGTGDRRSSC